MIIPDYVRFVMEHLETNGYDAYLVGGGVRDIINNRTPKDYDISTTATPRQILGLFRKIVPVGRIHGADVVLMMENRVEVNTLWNGRIYTHDLKEDLSTRDFTVNAMAMDLSGKVYDYFNGLSDIRDRMIRAVGDPDERLREDPLRMMRAIRFSVLFDFCIDQATSESIVKNSELIREVDKKRVRDELCKILLSEYPAYGVELLQSFNLLGSIMPELTGLSNHGAMYENTMNVLNRTAEKLDQRLAALLRSTAGPSARINGGKVSVYLYGHRDDRSDLLKKVLKRLRFSSEIINSVIMLVRGQRPDTA